MDDPQWRRIGGPIAEIFLPTDSHQMAMRENAAVAINHLQPSRSESTARDRLCYYLNAYMAATVEISVPDALIKALGAEPAELPRQTLEALIIQAYRRGQITHAQVGELLDFRSLGN